MYVQIKKIRIYPAVVVLTSLMGSVVSPVYAEDIPREQMFVVTAYYSPLPNQCCYFRGNYEDEIIFNGNGTNGADGTAVYPGMIAAPETYPFGTVIELPGLGIGTVHDRGSRIIEWDDDVHRIDLWMGEGEEGLARALVWGTRTVEGIVHALDSGNRPKEDWSLDRFDANPAVLTWLPKSDPVLSVAEVSFGDRAYSVRMLQKSLKALGYFGENTTGSFGPVTQDALRRFLADYGIGGDGSAVGAFAALALSVAESIEERNLPEVRIVGMGMNGDSVRQVQKLLRFLGYYEGRTDGVFDADVKDAVTEFQLRSGTIRDPGAQGSGRVGPMTRGAIRKAWKAKIVAQRTERLVEKQELSARIAENLPGKVLSKGDRGGDVRRLQILLRDLSYLPAKDVTGTFGDRTEAAVLRYQLDRGIVKNEGEHGAGVFGPLTKSRIAADIVEVSWQKVRSGAM